MLVTKNSVMHRAKGAQQCRGVWLDGEIEKNRHPPATHGTAIRLETKRALDQRHSIHESLAHGIPRDTFCLRFPHLHVAL